MGGYSTVKCNYCDEEFTLETKVLEQRLKKNVSGNVYCSVKCSRQAGHRSNNFLKTSLCFDAETLKRKGERKEPNVVCEGCGKGLYRTASQLSNSKTGVFYCNKECKQRARQHQAEPKPPYRVIAFQHHKHTCNRCDFSVVEILEVHHRNRDREDNSIENLEILCPNCHLLDHFEAGDGRWGGKTAKINIVESELNEEYFEQMHKDMLKEERLYCEYSYPDGLPRKVRDMVLYGPLEE